MTRTPSTPHALLIAIATYADPAWNAPVTVGDARGVRDALLDPAAAGYDPANVIALEDGAAGHTGVLTALANLAKAAQPDDTVVVFFAGHGALGEDGVYHLATHDAVFTADGRVQLGTGLPQPALIEALRGIRARKLLLVINACFSGHVQPSLGPAGAPPHGAAPTSQLGIDLLTTGEGRAFISACRPSQKSYFRPTADRTLFGKALEDALRGVNVSGDGPTIDLFDLYEALYRDVTASASAIGCDQEPVITLLQGVGGFPIVHRPAGGASSTSAVGPGRVMPAGLAVEAIAPAVVAAARGGSGDASSRDGPGSRTAARGGSLIDFGGAHIGGSVTIGDVARGNIIKITVTRTEAAAASDVHSLMAVLEKIAADVERLAEDPSAAAQADALADAVDELRKAREAGKADKRPRLLDKLESAHRLLLVVSGALPAAARIAEAVGTALQRAVGLIG